MELAAKFMMTRFYLLNADSNTCCNFHRAYRKHTGIIFFSYNRKKNSPDEVDRHVLATVNHKEKGQMGTRKSWIDICKLMQRTLSVSK